MSRTIRTIRWTRFVERPDVRIHILSCSSNHQQHQNSGKLREDHNDVLLTESSKKTIQHHLTWTRYDRFVTFRPKHLKRTKHFLTYSILRCWKQNGWQQHLRTHHEISKTSEFRRLLTAWLVLVLDRRGIQIKSFSLIKIWRYSLRCTWSVWRVLLLFECTVRVYCSSDCSSVLYMKKKNSYKCQRTHHFRLASRW